VARTPLKRGAELPGNVPRPLFRPGGYGDGHVTWHSVFVIARRGRVRSSLVCRNPRSAGRVGSGRSKAGREYARKLLVVGVAVVAWSASASIWCVKGYRLPQRRAWKRRNRSAHGSHSPRHGGLVLMRGDTHFEVVLEPWWRVPSVFHRREQEPNCRPLLRLRSTSASPA
jgi:hypothetical protein